MRAAVPLDDIYVCPHNKYEHCRCHKPSLGMIADAVARWGIDLTASYVIGDRWRDVDAGRAAGCYSILIDRPYSNASFADARVATLREAVGAVLQHAEGA
jgi:D-glycero-D-manno-heptose 1,7-bisphosphate phosphatase